MKLDHRFQKFDRGPQHGQYKSPVGHLLATFDQAHEAGCLQAEMLTGCSYFGMLMVSTRLNPCDGCPVWKEDGPACGTFQMYHTAYAYAKESQEEAIKKATTPPVVQGHPEFIGLTTKQIAEKLGISKNEVRRRKAAGGGDFRFLTQKGEQT